MKADKFPGRIAAALLLAALLAGAPRARAQDDDIAKYRADMTEGITLLRAGSRDDLSRAIAKFKSALKVQPESAEAFYWIALAYSDQNNYLRAVDNAKDATIYNEKMVDAWLLWGQVLLYQKEWQEALNKLETAERLAPDNPQVLFNIGRVQYHGFRNPDAALAKFRTVWQNSQLLRRERPELVPMLLRSRLYMGFCEFDRQRWDNAVNAFLDVLSEQPANAEAAFRLALAYRRNNRAPECERILQNMLRNIPPDTSANRQILAEINLQLADIYLKDPALRNRMFALTHLREFVNQIGDLGHPALEPAREYLAKHEEIAGS